ncbi:MAG: hypothetical protein R3B13_20380 [Polyangiaceae bacterium]
MGTHFALPFGVFELLGAAVDGFHALAMVVWGLGLPLLFFQRWQHLTRAFVWYSLVFLSVSVLSYFVLGECFLTTLAREAYEAGHNPELREHTTFIVRTVEFVAGIRPSSRAAVLIWEAALFVGCIITLVHLRRHRKDGSSAGRDAPAAG